MIERGNRNIMIDLKKPERLYLFIVILSIILLIFHSKLDYLSYNLSDSSFLLLHTLLELFSIFVSFSIFVQSWSTFFTHKIKSQYFLGLIFLAVGCFDLVHTLTFRGMPFIVDEFSAARATWFWIVARITESVGVAVFILMIERFSFKNRGFGLGILILFISICTSIILFLPEQLPMLIHETSGITPLKKSLEYVISIVNLLTFITLLKRYRKHSSINSLRFMLAIFFIMIGELYFTLYFHVYDIENLMGHIFKFVGYIYLYRSVFFSEFHTILSGKEEAERKRLESELKLYEAEKNLSRKVYEAHEEERKRVSRELHDSIGQSLYSILVTLNTLNKENSVEKKAEGLEMVKTITEHTIQEVKGIAQALRPSTLDDFGFIPALRSYLDFYKRVHNISVQFEVLGQKKRLKPEVETALYRICQEALNNTAKYAKASLIQVTIHIDPEETVHLKIQDNGIGFNVEDYLMNSKRKGIGLFSMKERVEGLEGTIQYSSKVNEGTTINIRIPINDEPV